MEKIPAHSSFEPTRHAVARLQERFYPDMNDERAAQLLLHLARKARPVKIPANPSSRQQEGEA